VPSHGIVLWLSLPPSLDPDLVYEEALRQGVLVSPSPMWSADPDAPSGIRLAFCAESNERLAEGARRLSKAVKILLSRSARGHRRSSPVLEAV
jgi:2-aminoadipate transaminase